MTARYFGTTLELLLVLTLLVGCEPGPYVSPLNSPILPSPSPAYEVSRELPQPAEGKAILTGVLKVEHTDTAMMGVELYLANHIGATPDTPMYSMDPSSAPRTATDNEGYFVFRDVPPGHYAIVVWSPFNSFLIRDPKTKLSFALDVQPNQVYDIGTFYEPLP